mmetsp:Transcript_14804/g.48502  ORF Transcript_14804/g.48502 Transcript_14804/m.48502 type:complete len:516 (-) Transcript_14804:72-1619(-)
MLRSRAQRGATRARAVFLRGSPRARSRVSTVAVAHSPAIPTARLDVLRGRPRPRSRVRCRAATAAATSALGAVTVVVGVVGLALSLAVLRRRASAPKPQVVAAPTRFNSNVLARCRRFREAYLEFFGLVPRGAFAGHLSTLVVPLLREKAELDYCREVVRMSDGGHVTLDWVYDDDGSGRPEHLKGLGGGGPPAPEPSSASSSSSVRALEPLPEDAPLMVALSGIGGGSQDSYIKYFLGAARKLGYRGVVFNSRGCASGPVTTPQLYSASFTDDVRAIMRMLRERHGHERQIFAIGWSLGANILANYLGEDGEEAPLDAAAVLCNPWDLALCDRFLEETRIGRKVYNPFMADGLRRLVVPNASLFRGLEPFDIDRALTAETVREFDDAITRISFGFETVDDYYVYSGSCHRVANVGVPTLCLNADDDPVSAYDAIPHAALLANPNCTSVVTPGGGHLGWIAGETAPGGAPWCDAATLEWFEAVRVELQQNQTALDYSEPPLEPTLQPERVSERAR